MISGHPHLSDDQLLEVCLELCLSPDTKQHLHGCPHCDARRASLARLLDEVDRAVTIESNGAFPPERLAKQRARIMHHVQQDGRPARIIAFPAASTESGAPRRRPATRWLAAAAAAGLIVGLVAGHFTRQTQRTIPQIASESIVRTVASSTLLTTTAGASDDEFIGQIETALDSPSASVLLPLEELTPLAWEEQ